MSNDQKNSTTERAIKCKYRLIYTKYISHVRAQAKPQSRDVLKHNLRLVFTYSNSIV